MGTLAEIQMSKENKQEIKNFSPGNYEKQSPGITKETNVRFIL